MRKVKSLTAPNCPRSHLQKHCRHLELFPSETCLPQNPHTAPAKVPCSPSHLLRDTSRIVLAESEGSEGLIARSRPQSWPSSLPNDEFRASSILDRSRRVRGSADRQKQGMRMCLHPRGVRRRSKAPLGEKIEYPCDQRLPQQATRCWRRSQNGDSAVSPGQAQGGHECDQGHSSTCDTDNVSARK